MDIRKSSMLRRNQDTKAQPYTALEGRLRRLSVASMVLSAMEHAPRILCEDGGVG